MITSALSFGAATSDRVDVAGYVSTPTALSFLMYVLPTTTTASRRWFTHADASDVAKTECAYRGTDANDLVFTVPRATTNAQAATTGVNIATGVRYAVAGTYSEANGAKVFTAANGSPLSEASYSSNVTGSGGTLTSDGRLIIGNYTSQILAFQGRIYTFTWWEFELTLGELRRAQQGKPVRQPTIDYALGAKGTGRVRDYSGNNYHGTITGAVPTSDNLPWRWAA